MHLIKLGIARHFIASAIIGFGNRDVFPDSAASIAALLDGAFEDFVWCCRNETWAFFCLALVSLVF